jgi:molybdopterin converting factor small subunit
MRHLKRFNEQKIEGKDLQETIDEILDNLSKKGKLSESEKEFMDEASNRTIKSVTKPSMSGNFWSDMGNPHNLGIMWMGKNGVFQLLKSVEDEDKNNDWNKYVKSQKDSEFNRKSQEEKKKKKFFEDNPELESDLNKLLDMYNQLGEYTSSLSKKYKNYSKNNYNFSTSLDYALKKKDSLINLFGYYKDGESDSDDAFGVIGIDPEYDK